MKCQLIKLKSGEELISDIGIKTKTKCELINPYVIRFTVMIDPVLGVPYDVSTIKDWLVLSDIKKINIPTNHIVNIFEPSVLTKKLYKQELKRTKDLLKQPKLKPKDKIPDPNTDIIPSDKDLNNNEIRNFIEDILSNMFSNESPTLEENNFYDSMSMTPEDQYKDIPDPINLYNEAFPPRKRKSNKNRPLIQMNMLFPPEVLIDLMESGIINVNDINKIAKEIKNKLNYTGDERHRKDFGNKLSDWNPDINSDDYK